MEVETARTRDEHGGQQYQEAWRLHATRLAKAETAIKTAEERLQFVRNDLTRLESLLRIGIISRQQWEEGQEQARLREKDLEIARAELQLVSDDDLSETRKQSAIAQKEVAEAEGKLRVLRAGARPEAVEALEAEIARLEIERQYSKQQLDRVQVVSPAAGVVTTSRTEEKVGQHVNKGDLIVEVYELQRVTPEVEIPENEIGDIQVDQPVLLKARAYPEKTFAGRVAAIAPTAQADPLQRKVVRVTVQMDQADGLLKPEMTGNAKILCGKRPIYQLLTRRLARYVRVEFWSLW
jgi:multidrug resistance efflux pump